ncbi:16S rRNA (cytosine(1402)-N(4))-methyltransferase RsmH [Corynebacterium felinum]|uniref:Ribosomal RNA small subunit methyltransferase H n=1 Tax=Corynebacterium felinum TaxID=131318 RepID=A0ABU2BDV1_9CORY|nr:16S rRNA (cytosine(1402)-N(4))-methyltransferase RsmH [Corynebacterium felinum]MDF5820914.1 16S rRNA (cytosine(1402)-N(4))-methyltransferase RsmH [Corynebacterium felinum]MDR7356144.1 16S rRNA (cytosine1402-N4)-methyltransferase [Corynebacterium felinum]WJY95478.1 Ribosomal RNA small subunit methyltransferase H [Corynebacterium felinum]
MAEKSSHRADLQANFGHVPVLRDRVTELLAPAVEEMGDQAVIIDGTLGAGGHSEFFLKSFPQAYVIGLDRDINALTAARERLAPFGDRFVGLHTRFDQFLPLMQEEAEKGNTACRIGIEVGITGALFDLGVSSMQLDQVDRGFAYRVDAPLDMRMNDTEGITAADILNTYSHGDIARILKTYGDERFAGKIASAIVREREKQPFSTSARLVELLYANIPAATRRTGGHPAKRTFQALRVEVNRELEAIENVIPLITDLLVPGGRAVFMSYQSLEDKIVKKFFTELTTSKTPAGLPMDLPEYAAKFELITRGAEKANEKEIEENPRSAPVRVRAIQAKKGAR